MKKKNLSKVWNVFCLFPRWVHLCLTCVVVYTPLEVILGNSLLWTGFGGDNKIYIIPCSFPPPLVFFLSLHHHRFFCFSPGPLLVCCNSRIIIVF